MLISRPESNFLTKTYGTFPDSANSILHYISFEINEHLLLFQILMADLRMDKYSNQTVVLLRFTICMLYVRTTEFVTFDSSQVPK